MTKEQLIALGLPDDMATKAAAASVDELKNYVPKHRFDEVSDENKNLKGTVKANETALEELKKSAGDSEALKKQIDDLQKDNKSADEKYQNDLKELKLTNAIKLGIAGKAHDEDLVAGLFDKTKLILGDDGKITGLDEQMKTLKESKAFLFKAEENKPGFKPFVGGGASGTQTPPGTSGTTMSLKDAIAAQLGQQ